jgi:uncharacterized protein (DUF2336 family)
MSEPITRDYSFTVRLSAEERAQLDALAAQWNMDKSATVRRALQMALSERQRLPQAGHFVAVQPEEVSFPVRLSGKVANGG